MKILNTTMKKQLIILLAFITLVLSVDAMANYQISQEDLGSVIITKTMHPDKSCKFIKEAYFPVPAKEIYTDTLKREVPAMGGNFVFIREYGYYSYNIGGDVYSCPK